MTRTTTTLNKDRGRSPSDTLADPAGEGSHSDPLNKDRGRSPSDTRDLLRLVTQAHIRSTKTGAEAPVTPCPFQASTPDSKSLNKDRGRSPSDTRLANLELWSSSPLNKDRGRSPSDTMRRLKR